MHSTKSFEQGRRILVQSILIKDTTREERIRIVNQGLAACGTECEGCNGCDNLGGGSVERMYEPYIEGLKELRDINMEYNRSTVHG